METKVISYVVEYGEPKSYVHSFKPQVSPAFPVVQTTVGSPLTAHRISRKDLADDIVDYFKCKNVYAKVVSIETVSRVMDEQTFGS